MSPIACRTASALLALALAGPALADSIGTPLHQSEPGPPLVIHQTDARSPLEIVAIDAAYGGLAGALVGTGVSLIEQGHFWRDLTVGAGAGILAGAVAGGFEAYAAGQSSRVATDGLGTPDRDPPLASVHTVLSYRGRLP